MARNHSAPSNQTRLHHLALQIAAATIAVLIGIAVLVALTNVSLAAEMRHPVGDGRTAALLGLGSMLMVGAAASRHMLRDTSRRFAVNRSARR